jgi:hypothetical protein
MIPFLLGLLTLIIILWLMPGVRAFLHSLLGRLRKAARRNPDVF